MKKRGFLFNKAMMGVPVLLAVVVMCAVASIGTCAKTKDLEKITDSIPVYSGVSSTTLNDNSPLFTEAEITASSFEKYGELDELGRCTRAFACIGKDLMPTKERESISMVKPTGWDQEKYPGLIDTDPPYLYNRCHMIGYQLTGENANEKNLITGTRYMNADGMLPYENEVAEYVRSTGNHVMYRVTPVFDGNNLLCDGVQIEAMSVEDKGKGISFNVFCYNVQPGVSIDYSDGSNELDRSYNRDDQAKKNEGSVSAGDEKTTFTLEEFAAPESSDNTENVSRAVPEKTYSYIGNRNSHVFHYPDCDSVKDMKEKNKVYFENATKDEIMEKGFRPCQRCSP